MNAVSLQSFGFGEKLVRVMDRAGVAWFVANDVCAALEIGNTGQAVSRLEEDERDGVITNDTVGREQRTTIISESGVYALIFTSRKAAAKRFRKWVTQEVLPAIRTTGRYEARPANDDLAARPGRKLDLREALGTIDERHAIKTALLTVQMYTELYGQQVGREMMERLGFPTPGVELPAPQVDAGTRVPVEGDIHQWSVAVGLTPSRRGATHQGELYESYSRWCGAQGVPVMHARKFRDAMVMLFGHEEHPEMIRVVLTR